MDTNTKITIACNEPECLARGIGHENYWSPNADMRDAVNHQHWRSTDGPAVAVEKFNDDESVWFLNLTDGYDELTDVEAVQFAANLSHGAHLVAQLNGN